MRCVLPLALALLTAPAASAQTRRPACAAPLADLVRGTLGGLPPGASPAQVRTRMPCLRPDAAAPGRLEGPRARADDADPPFAAQPEGWMLYAAFAGTTRPAVLGLPMRTALARLRARGVRVAFPLGDTDDAFALRTRYGCLVLYANDAGRVEQIQMSPSACASP